MISKRLRLVSSSVILMCAFPGIADAQMYIMRTKLTVLPGSLGEGTPSLPTPTPTPAPTPTPSVTWAWEAGSWTPWSSNCSEAAVRTRSVICRGSDRSVGTDASCTAQRPASTETAPNMSGCPVETHDYEWKSGSWSTWSSTCSTNAVRTRSVHCERDDGQLAGDGSCEASMKPSSSETREEYSGCTNKIQYNDADMLRDQYCQGQVQVKQNVWCVNQWGSPQDMSVCNREGIATPAENISLPCTRRDFVTGNAFWSQGVQSGFNYRTMAYEGHLNEAQATAKALEQCNSSDYLADVQNHGFCYFISYTWVPSANVTLIEAGPRNSGNQGSVSNLDMTGADRKVLNKFNTMTHEFTVDDRAMDKFQRKLIQCGSNFQVSSNGNYVAAIRCMR